MRKIKLILVALPFLLIACKKEVPISSKIIVMSEYYCSLDGTQRKTYMQKVLLLKANYTSKECVTKLKEVLLQTTGTENEQIVTRHIIINAIKNEKGNKTLIERIKERNRNN